MAAFVEGEWKEFEFKYVTPADHELIFEFLRKYWYPDEIMGKYAGIDEDYIQDFEGICRLAFAEDLSFIAWHKDSKEIAALRLTFTSRKSDDWSAFEFRSQAVTKLLKLIKILDAKANIYEKYGIEYLANFLLACVGREYRGKGLATEMYKRSIQLLKSKGFPLCKSAFSSPYTRKATMNLGFTEIARVYLKDFCNENGEMDFKGAGDDDCTAILCLQL